MGTDRFRIWPDKGKGGSYWCRQCGIRGDGIAFLRTFHGMSFQDACKAMGISIQSQYSPQPQKNLRQEQSVQWRKSAHTFLLQCQKNVRHPALQERYLSAETCFTCGIGFNAQDQYPHRSVWGLRNEQGENGKLRTKLKIPQGIVIATFRKKEIVALTVRTHDPKSKYWQVKGSANVPFLVGKANTPLVLLESALDAVLLHQESGASCVAFMGSTKPPDATVLQAISHAPLVLACPDNDTAGHSAWQRWKVQFPAAILWPPLEAKDVGEMHSLSMKKCNVPSLKNWYKAALIYAQNLPQKRELSS